MKLKDLTIIIIAVILAFVFINILWTLVALVTRIIVFLAVVLIIYLLLKKIL